MTDAAAAAVVLEGQLKWREGKKWKSRWLVLRKPSPVADCLLLLVYKERAERLNGLKERSSLTLEDICGLEPGLCYEGLNHTLAIICLTQVVMLGFENKETMQVWDAQIRYRLGEVHRFQVVAAPGTKLESGPATLHFCNDILVLVKDVPPTILGQWKLSDLRRYGAVPNGFVFEGGTRCGFWAGVFLLSCTEGEKISFLFDCIVHGISPTKGLRQALADSSTDPACVEERVAYEASQLEKRLSLLSHAGCHSSGGDDRSLSSTSSDTSRSDASSGSRLTLWPELLPARTSQEPHGLAAAKGLAPGEGRLHLEGARGSAKALPKAPHCRQLQEIGRQSSSDSGIATGSHSSYSGSFSSHAGSLDICPGEDFGSLASLPPGSPADQALCGCLQGEPPRSLGSEYQRPSSLRHSYDTPRGLFPVPPGPLFKDQTCKGAAKQLAAHPEGAAAPRPGQEKALQAAFAPDDAREPEPHWGWQDSRSPATSPFGATSGSACGLCGSASEATPLSLFRSCPECGVLKETSILSSQIFPPTLGGPQTEPGLYIAGPEGSYELTMPRTSPGLRLDPEGAGELPGSERLPSDLATYINIPASPRAKQQLHYMELDLQGPATSLRGNESSRYAQIDITATEAAQRVGAQHAQGREERLQELEQKKDGRTDGGPRAEP